MVPFSCLFFVLLALVAARSARSEDVLVAVATNFVATAELLEADYEAATGHALRIVSGSTGKLFAQIVHGAPFDVFLAADAARPARLAEDGLAVEDSLRTYAIGRLALWRPANGFEGESAEDALRAGTFRRLAIANPDLAPYGAAARQMLERLSLWDRLSGRLVMGENIGQVFALVATGNAEVGLIAASQRLDLADGGGSSILLVPKTLHDAIRQDAVLLVRARANPAALAFLDFLDSPAARARIRAHGYDLPHDDD